MPTIGTMTAPPSLSPSALNRFLGCEHRTYLDLLERRGELDAERRPPKMQLLFERGDRHEAQVVDGLRADGRDVVALDDPDADVETRAARTIAAMREGREVLHQGCFVRDGWVGYPDFLVRVDDTPSALGPWSYEVHDAKMGSHPQPDHIFQLLFYTDELERIQGVRPAQMHLMLGSGETPSFSPDDFSAYAARVREQFEARFAELEAGAAPAYPYPVPACEFCHWWHVCEARRRRDDHLSLVANLTRGQGLRFETAGIHDVPALAALNGDLAVPRIAKATVATLQDQADLQLRSRGLERPLYRVLQPEPERGLARLPEPSAGDVHFDFEGDQYWGEDGLEYLFGTLYQDGGEWTYWPMWAHSRAEEQAAFETWMRWITGRLDEFPDLHVFHYNSYEPVALKKLVARYGTCEHEVDELLRRKVFVDLYGITRQAVRVGTEGYGLKALEPAFGFERSAELKGAVGSMQHWQAYQDDGDAAHLRDIGLYNRDDVLSTVALYGWLRELRSKAEATWNVKLSTLQPEPPEPLSPKTQAWQDRADALRPRLLEGLPDDESLDDEEQRARRVAFDLVGYHRREGKPAWWALFDRRDRTVEQLRDEDNEAIGGLEVIAREELPRSWRWTLRFPEQEHKLGPGAADDPVAECGVTLESLDEATRTVVVKRGKPKGDVPPVALAPGGPYTTDAQVDALFAFAERVAGEGFNRAEAGLDLLLRRPPRFRPGTPPLVDEPFSLERACAQVRGLDRSALVIQGPPGTGKTFNGARLALDLMQHGLRVGVTATSHKAINNFLKKLDEAADELGTTFRGWRKKSDDSENNHESGRIRCAAAPDESEGRVLLHAGTAWHWARDDIERVDVLFIDEAGQVSLADAIAVSQGAESVVLLGDPQQLAHVSQGTHLRGSGASVLQHMLGDAATVPPDRGLLLEESWRMHPDVCDFVSRTMYDGRLTAEAHCARQRIDSRGLSGTGLRMIPVDHCDNRARSIEEAKVIAAEIDALLDGGTYVDRNAERYLLTLDDILVVAPYNAQVRCLRSKLPPGARVGTVDKFQGQEAPVVLFSMATSSGDDVSRGMRFLFSRNRLNVAISRAQMLAAVVCSPKLLAARCSTVEDMRLVNLLCQVADAARWASRT